MKKITVTKRNGGNGNKTDAKSGAAVEAAVSRAAEKVEAGEATEVVLTGRIDPKALESLDLGLVKAPQGMRGVMEVLERAALEPIQYTRKKGKNAGQVITVGHRLGFGTGAATALKKLGYTNKQIHELMLGEKDLRNTLTVGATCWLMSKGWVGNGMRVGKASANITFKHPDRMPQGERRAAGPSKAELEKQLAAQQTHAAMLEAKLARLVKPPVDVEATVTQEA